SLLDQVGQTYRNIVDRVVADLISGLKSPQQALRGAVRQLANRGLIALVDSRGRNWSLEGYVGMILRTMSTKIANEMQEARFDEWGVDLVRRIIDRKSTRLNSSHVKISYAVFCLKKKNTEK